MSRGLYKVGWQEREREKSKSKGRPRAAALCAYSISVASGRTRAFFLNLSWESCCCCWCTYPSFHRSPTMGTKANVIFRTWFPVRYDPEETMGYRWRQLLSFLQYFTSRQHSFISEWIKQVFFFFLPPGLSFFLLPFYIMAVSVERF